MIEFIASANLPTEFGMFKIHAFLDKETNKEHFALVYGDVNNKDNVPLRIHSECLTGDTFFSQKCDCGFQLKSAMQFVVKKKLGVIFYLRQEGRGIGILNKIKAYSLQDKGLNTIDANVALGFADDLRDYSMCKVMLDFLEIKNVQLITNNPLKITRLQDLGILITDRIAMDIKVNEHNQEYLNVKKNKMGHLF